MDKTTLDKVHHAIEQSIVEYDFVYPSDGNKKVFGVRAFARNCQAMQVLDDASQEDFADSFRPYKQLLESMPFVEDLQSQVFWRLKA